MAAKRPAKPAVALTRTCLNKLEALVSKVPDNLAALQTYLLDGETEPAVRKVRELRRTLKSEIGSVIEMVQQVHDSVKHHSSEEATTAKKMRLLQTELDKLHQEEKSFLEATEAAEGTQDATVEVPKDDPDITAEGSQDAAAEKPKDNPDITAEVSQDAPVEKPKDNPDITYSEALELLDPCATSTPKKSPKME